MIRKIRSVYLINRFVLSGINILCAVTVFADVRLPAIFSDKMVLQQKAKVTVWGWADAGEKITVTPSWRMEKSFNAKADASGNWKIIMPTPSAGGPYLLKIKGNNVIELKDVLVGEVWVCSGQSNMVFSLKSSKNAKAEIAVANFPSIRYFSIKRQYGPQEFKDAPGSQWEKTSSETAGSFSVVAYYFAKKINQQLNVPIGIVYTAWGGTPAEAWIPKNVLQKDTDLFLYLDRWKKIQDNVEKDSVAYHIAFDEWEKNKASNTSLKKPAEPQTLFYFKRPWREPGVLFNGMINPLIPYTIKGVLWFQGESNVAYANEYYHLFSSMINNWRSRWNNSGTQKELPFYFVQITPFAYSNMNAAATLREAQYQVMQQVPHTGMVVTIDVGEMKDQHFKNKKEVGERLALIALAKDYGNKIIFKGPEIKNGFTEKDKVIIEFESSFSDLNVGGDTLKGFEIGYHSSPGDSIVFVNAQAKLNGNKVIVWNDKVMEPVEVRYAWLLAGEANLFNKKGLPAFPFRMKVKN
jgi:sialate O-acetylesterase